MKGLIEAIDAESLKAEVPAFNVGDTVKVGYKIIEGGKRRHSGKLHGAPYFLRRGRGKNLSSSFPEDRVHQGREKG